MAEISPFEFSKMVVSRHFGYDKPEIAPFDPTIPKTPPLLARDSI